MGANISQKDTRTPIDTLTTGIKSEVVVIGAGVSGLSLANSLNTQGIRVRVFEKSRGTGGRLCSKRLKVAQHSSNELLPEKTPQVNDVSFDLGASSFKAVTPNFKKYIASMLNANVLCESRGGLEEYVAVPRNSMLTRHLSAPLDVSFSTKITRIEQNNGMWFVYGVSQADRRQPQSGHSEKHTKEVLMACSNHVVLSAPAEQTYDLLPMNHGAQSWLKGVQSDPLFISTFIFKKHTIDSKGIEILKSHSCDIVNHVSIEHEKPQRDQEHQIIKFTSNASWAKNHLDNELERVEKHLMAKMLKILFNTGLKEKDVVKQYTHKWLYGEYSNLINSTKGYLSFSDNLHIVGDYFNLSASLEENSPLQQRICGVERAYISGQRLKDHFLNSDIFTTSQNSMLSTSVNE